MLLNIFSINLNDDINFEINRIKLIRERSVAGGIRAYITAYYDTIEAPLKIDFSTGDSITPDAVARDINLLLDQKTISVLSYNRPLA